MSQAVTAYRDITATEEFRYLEYLRSKTGHDEAQALHNARRQEREKWQGVVAEVIAEKDAVLANKDAENADLRAQLEALRKQIGTV